MGSGPYPAIVGVEIERKFLVSDDRWRDGAEGVAMRQGYLCADGQRTVRVREAGDRAWITIKGPSEGLTRAEFEYEIPRRDAGYLLDHLCARPLIEKTRWALRHGAHTWEIDEFGGQNAGLIVAEIELASEDETFEPPPWLGHEVTGDRRYSNAALVRRPYSTW